MTESPTPLLFRHATTRRVVPLTGPGSMQLWTVPYVPHARFIGRERLLSELQAAFVPGEFKALVCLGCAGVGKTQLAVQYAFGRRHDYDAVLWISAESLVSLRANFARLAADCALGLPAAADSREPAQIAAVVSWLRAHDRWLLICDDAGAVAADALIELLHDVPSGHVLFTSRQVDWPVELADLTLDRFSDDVAVEFLRWRTQPWNAGSDVDAAAVGRELGGLPLHLEQAAAYLEQKRVRYDTYLAQLKAAELPNDQRSIDQTDYREYLPAAFRISEAQLAPGARAILRLLSFFATESLPRAPFEGASAILREATALLARDPSLAAGTRDASANATEALEQLERFALIELTPSTLSWRQSLISEREAIPRSEFASWLDLALRIFDDALARDAAGAANAQRLAGLHNHASALLRAAEELGPQPTAAQLFTDYGALLHTQGRFHEAEALLRSALALHEATRGPDHPELVEHLQRLADVLSAMSRTEEAEPITHRVLRQQLAGVLDQP